MKATDDFIKIRFCVWLKKKKNLVVFKNTIKIKPTY